MKFTIKATAILLASLLVGGVQAEVTQDCMVEGKVRTKTDHDSGTNVYVAFHSVKKSNAEAKCTLARQKRVAFKQPKNAKIENAPVGSTVTYHYLEEDNRDGEWNLVTIGM